MNKKVILSSILSLVLCISLIVGGTFALFTHKTETNIAITSGKVEVVSTVEDLKLFSQEDINMTTLVGTPIEITEGNTFPNGGTATYANGTLTLDKLTPGDGVEFTIKTANNSNVAIMFRTIISSVSGNGLINALVVKINDVEYAGEAISDWVALAVGENPDDIKVSIELPVDAGNAYQNRTASLSIAVEAVQGNAKEFVDKWDGSTVADDFAAEEDGAYLIESAADLAAFAAAVNAGDNFAEKTVTLNANIDLAGNAWTPIVDFAGTFDGQGYTISNLSFAADGTEFTKGLFNNITATGVVKNVTLKNVSAELSGSAHTVGFLAGTIEGKAENCVVKNATITTSSRLQTSGGMFGNAYVNAVIDKCSVDGLTIYSTSGDDDSVGGLVGNVNAKHGYSTGEGVTITNSSAKNITIHTTGKTKKFGGFVGTTEIATLENCTASNVNITVDKNYSYVGGFIGTASNDSLFTNCDVNGAIINVANGGSNQAAGGFAGRIFVNANGTADVFKNCDVTGLYISVSGTVGGGVAGFCGEGNGNGKVTIENCTVAGKIEKVDATISGNGIVDTLIGNKWGIKTDAITGNVIITG